MIPAQVLSCEVIEILRKPNTSTLESNKENIHVRSLFQDRWEERLVPFLKRVSTKSI